MKLSVIIPCHNAAPYLAQTIGSALDQSRPPDEIIVVDDASTDDSRAIARGLAHVEPTVRVLETRNGRASTTRNYGALEATGDLLMFLDADDVIRDDTLEALATALGRDADAVAVCPWFRLELEQGTWRSRPPTCRPRHSGEDALAAWLTGWYHPPCAVLWSRRAFETAGRWDELATVNDDGDLMMRALLSGVRLAETSRGASYYRRLPAGQPSLSGSRRSTEGIASRLRIITKVAFRLESQGQLARYRPALASALDVLAGDAASHSDLQREVQAAARRYARARGGMRRPDEAATGARTNDAGQAVRAGLDRAERVHVAPAARAESHTRAAPTRCPLVSVIVPTFNRAHVLPRAIACVLGQTCRDVELLIVDDGSTDGTEALLASYTDARVRYLRQTENRGASAARNVGLRAARGRFVALLDSDDEWLPEKLALQLAVFAGRGAETGLVYTGVERIDTDGSSTVQRPRLRGNVYRELLWHNAIHGGGSNVMLRRNVVATAGFFHEALQAIEDYEYWLRVTRFFDVEFVDAPLVRYHDRRDAGRRSLALKANLDARWWLYETYAADMRGAGVAHMFLLNTARWALLYGGAEMDTVRPLLTRAVREKPTSRTALATLLGTTVPGAGHVPWVDRHAMVKPWTNAS